MKQYQLNLLNLTCGYPPWGIALTLASFSSRSRDSFNTGGVRKSVCKTMFLDDARFAYVNSQCIQNINISKKDGTLMEQVHLKVQFAMKWNFLTRRSTISRICFTSLIIFWSTAPLTRSSALPFTACASWHTWEAILPLHWTSVTRCKNRNSIKSFNRKL